MTSVDADLGRHCLCRAFGVPAEQHGAQTQIVQLRDGGGGSWPGACR
jgi:hypothetical protein